MKCPRCGHEMTLDIHRKIPLNMCYDCGYIEGRSNDGDQYVSSSETNYSHMKELNFNEQVAFLSAGLGIEEEKLRVFLEASYKA